MTKPSLKVCFVISEAEPLIKVGGLGDVGGTLPAALRALPPEMTDGREVMKELQKYNAEIVATNVNIRTGAGTEYRVLGMETKGYRFYKIGEDYDGSGMKWYNFVYRNNSGYIRSDFVKIIGG